MRGALFIGVILALPPIAAFGHDLYLAYGQGTEIDLSKPFQLSDVGWLWENYSYESWAKAKAAVDPAAWSKWIRPILEQSTLIVTAIPALVFFAIAGTARFVQNSGLIMMLRHKGNAAAQRAGLNFNKGADKEQKKKTTVRYKRK